MISEGKGKIRRLATLRGEKDGSGSVSVLAKIRREVRVSGHES